MRAQSPSSAHQYHYSPTRHRPNLSSDDRKAEDKKVEKNCEQSKTETPVKKTINSVNSSLQDEKNVVGVDIAKVKTSKGEHFIKGDASEKNQSPDRKSHMPAKVGSPEKKMQNNIQEEEKKKGARMFLYFHY